ncbi:MAG: DUF4399 domain-containing protein [Aliidongia sp.]
MSKKLTSGFFGAGAVLAVLLSGTVAAQEPEHQGLTITTPADGAVVMGPVTVAVSAGGGDHGGHHGHGGGRQIFLLIDQPAPEPGATIQADPSHIAFPEDAKETTLTLAPGKHTLQLAVLDREGHVGRRFHPVAPISVTVQ